MKQDYIKYSLVIFYTSLLIFIGFYRDFLFVNINALIKGLDYGISYDMPSSISFFETWEYQSLIISKWVLTVLFIFAYWIITILFTKLFFSDKKRIRFVTIAYLVVFLTSLFFYCISKISGNYEYKFYLLSRFLAGVIQSPLILMILLLAFTLYRKSENEKKKA